MTELEIEKMAYKIVLCIFAVLSQSIADPFWQNPPSCGNDVDISVPVYNCEGIAIQEIDSYQPSLKPISLSNKKEYSYKPSVRLESYKPISVPSSSVSYSESYKPVSSIPIPDNGGSLIVTSVGPISPIGIGVASDVSLAGELVLSGVLPYLSAVAFEGQFDSSGAAPVEYGCGDCVAITEQIGGSGYSPLGGCGKY